MRMSMIMVHGAAASTAAYNNDNDSHDVPTEKKERSNKINKKCLRKKSV